MSASAAAVWRALVAAMVDSPAMCNGDDRFVGDSTRHDAELSKLCAVCPLLAACHAYAVAEKPTAGFWAGRRYPRPVGRPKEEGAADG